MRFVRFDRQVRFYLKTRLADQISRDAFQPMSKKLEKKTRSVPMMYSNMRRLDVYFSKDCGSVSWTRRDALIAKTPKEQNTPAMNE